MNWAAIVVVWFLGSGLMTWASCRLLQSAVREDERREEALFEHCLRRGV